MLRSLSRRTGHALLLTSMVATGKGAKAGDKIAVTWVDNRGDKRSDEATVS